MIKANSLGQKLLRKLLLSAKDLIFLIGIVSTAESGDYLG